MKKDLNKNLIVITILFVSTNCFSQVFEITTATSGEFGRTEIPIRGIGIGYFPSSQITDAALHINTNYMSTSSNYPGIDFGEVFRTDAPNGATYWKMFRNGNEIGRYWNNGTDNELNIGTVQTITNPNLNLYAGNSQRMTILGVNGFVGIGIPVPNFRLTVQDDINLIPGGFPDFGYRWDGEVILKTNSNSNIFLGYRSGYNILGSTGNTFLGAYSGFEHDGNSGGNTFVGLNAGREGNDIGEGVFVGSSAGEFNNGRNNSFVGVLSGRSTSGSTASGNSFLGSSSGQINTGNYNTFIGNYAGANNKSDLNTFVGYQSGQNNLGGINNVFTGANTGNSNTSGSNLAFFGYEAGFSNEDGESNTFGGSFSGWDNRSGSNNSFYGFESGNSNQGGNENVFLGSKAGSSNRVGSYNTFTGVEAGYSNTADNYNTYYGYYSGRNLSAGIKNTFIGSQSGSAITNGSGITLVGAGTIAVNGRTNATAIGSSAHVTGDDQMILGNNDVNVGIGLSGDAIGPLNKLEINADTDGKSGLRFRRLTNASFPAGTTSNTFLTVDMYGDVVLGDIPGSGGSIGACPGGLTATNFITKISSTNEICKTQGIFESPTAPHTVGLGVGSSVNSGPYNNFKLDLKGDIYLRHDFNNGIGGDIWMLDHTGTPRPVFTMYGLFGYGVVSLGPNAGSNSQFTSTLASSSVYIGTTVGQATANTRGNSFVGSNCGNNFTGTTTDGNNTFIGAGSGNNISTGNRNTFIGQSSGNSMLSGSDNTYVGQEAGHGGIPTGNHNILIGRGTYITANSGDMNICIGSAAHAYNWNGTITNAISIGASSRVNASNFVTIGRQIGGQTEQQIGLGYSAPPVPGIPGGTLAKLYVQNYGGGPTAAFFNGDVYSSGAFVPSDSILKDSIQPFTNAATIISQLEAKTYTYKHNTFPSLALPNGQQIGFMAEDIEALAPQLVTLVSSPADYDTSGNIINPQVDFKAVNYTGLIPVLFTAIKQQQHVIDSILIILSQCCSSPSIIEPPTNNRSYLELSNKDIVILNQNSPNPFNESTEISYHIPATVNNATIMFYDQSGKVLEKFVISHRGAGALTVYSEDLTSGIYSYTLIIDGKNHETKRMMKQ